LGFYVVSATAAAQHRSARMSRRVLRASIQGQPLQLADYHKLDEDRRPNYREAKKVGFDFAFRPTLLINLTPRVTDAEFAVFLLYWETHDFANVTATRGPPARSTEHA
jgi:hypothetical protein